MALETATYISQLVSSDPAHSDGLNQSDSHLRLIKAVLQAQFPNFTAAALTSTNAEIDAAVAFATSGMVSFNPGTAAAPAVNVVGDTTTGMYQSAAGHLGVTISGVATVDITSAGINLLQGGLLVEGTDVFPLSSAYLGTGCVTTAAIAASNVTYATMQNMSATTLLGNPTGSAAAPSEITLGNGLSFSGTTLSGTAAIGAVSHDLLIVNDGTSPNTKINITASEVVLSNGSGKSVYFDNVSVSIDTTTTGAGGMDTGTRGASASYFWWLISNGTLINALGSTSSTAPTMPSGYTFKKRIGGNFTNGSSNLLQVRQSYNEAQYVVGTLPASAVLCAGPSINGIPSTGIVGTYNTTSPTLSSISLSGFVPATANKVTLMGVSDWKGAGSGNNVLIAPNTNWGGTNNGPTGSNGNVFPFWLSGAADTGTDTVDLVLEGSQFAYCCSANGFAVGVQKWTDSI